MLRDVQFLHMTQTASIWGHNRHVSQVRGFGGLEKTPLKLNGKFTPKEPHSSQEFFPFRKHSFYIYIYIIYLYSIYMWIIQGGIKMHLVVR